jgi:hypothetical protein
LGSIASKVSQTHGLIETLGAIMNWKTGGTSFGAFIDWILLFMSQQGHRVSLMSSSWVQHWFKL